MTHFVLFVTPAHAGVQAHPDGPASHCLHYIEQRTTPSRTFLRRCVYHHIRFDDNIVDQAVKNRQEEYGNLSPDFLKMAVQRFLALRDRSLRKRPATGELLVWLQVLALAVGTYPKKLDNDLSKLPYIGVLLKDHQNIEELRGGRM